MCSFRPSPPHATFASLPFKKEEGAATSPPSSTSGLTQPKVSARESTIPGSIPPTGRLSVPVLAVATARPSFLALSPASNGRSASSTRSMQSMTPLRLSPPSASIPKPGPSTRSARFPPGEPGQPTSRSTQPATLPLSPTTSAAPSPPSASCPTAPSATRRPHQLQGPAEFGSRGPNSARQDAPHPHSANISPDNRFLLVSDLGTDHISVFIIDNARRPSHTSDPHLFTRSSRLRPTPRRLPPQRTLDLWPQRTRLHHRPLSLDQTDLSTPQGCWSTPTSNQDYCGGFSRR